MTTPPESCRCPSRDGWLRTGICPEATGAISLDSSILRDPEVAVLVIGARGTPAGRRPIGHAAMQLITSVAKPLVVVPPDVCEPERIERILVPLDGSPESAEAVSRTTELAIRTLG